MQQNQSLRNILAAHAEQTIGVVEPLLDTIQGVGELIAECFLLDHKVMLCGSSGAAAVSQYFTSLLVSGNEYERPGLPALALNADSLLTGVLSDGGKHHDGFAHQVRTLGNAGDVLLIFAANTNSLALAQSVVAAHSRQLRVVAVTGNNDGDIASMLGPEDMLVHVATPSRTRIIETHLLLAHCWCALIEQEVFGLGELA